MTENKGIILSGRSRIQAGAVVAGDNAQAHVVQYQAHEQTREYQELERELTALLLALRSAVETGQLPAGVLETGHVVQEQLAAEAPKKHAIMSMLAGIAGAAASVSTVVTAVDAVQALVTRLF